MGDEVVVVTGEYRGAKGTVDVLVIDHSDGAEVGEMGGDRLGSRWDSGMVGQRRHLEVDIHEWDWRRI